MVGGVLEKTKSVFSEIDGSSHHADFKDVSAEAPSTSLSIDSSRSNYRSASEDDTKETLMSVLKENSKKKERSKKKTTGKKTTKESQEEIVPPPEEINLNAMVSVTESTERVSSISDVNTIASFRSSSGSLSNKIDGGSSLSFDARSARGLFSKRSLQSEISQRLLSTSDFNLKNNKNIQELTINKLHYENIGHRERENELSTLQNCLDRLLSDEYDKKKELIWIKGQSGVGKTMLAKTLESRIAKMKGAISGYGSFDFNAADDNCSGIAAAFGEICHGIKKVKNFIAADLGLEAFLLSKLIPELNVLLPSIIRSSSSETERFDFRAGKEQWKHAFRVLLRTFNSYLSPMVLVLDDVQWADTSSLEVIEYLISDTDNANDLMIVCCYRPNEVAYVDVLSKIQDLSAMKSSSMYNLTALELGNFQLEMVNKVIMAMLSIDDEERTMGLTKICYKRTLGNPFFLIEFVTMLEEEELLTFNLGLLKWIWDERVIEDATMSTENIVSLVLARMEKVSEDAQLLMQYAACLGTSFKVSTLELIWRNHIPSTFLESKMVDLKTMLANLVDGNFIERCEKNDYRWVHNKVKEAALTFGDASNASFQFEIGTILFHSLSDKQLEESLFDVVDLINKGNVERRPNLAELNLRAAEKATLVSAFQSASTYVANGIKLLPQERWRLYRTTTLRLYTLGTEIEASLGRMDAMEKYSNEVLCRNDISILEKIPLYLAQTYRLCSVEMRYAESIDLSLQVLGKLGYSIRQGITLKMEAISSLLRTVKMAKKVPKDYFKAPQKVSDKKRRAVMVFMNRIFYACYFTQNKYLMVLLTSKMVRMTIKHGVTPTSGTAYTSLAIMTISVLKDLKTATFFGETANLIQKSNSSKFFESTTLFLSHFLVFPWSRPLQASIAPCLEAYDCGMRGGNSNYAMWSLLVSRIFLPYQMGKPLVPIEASCFSCIEQCNQVNQTEKVNISQCLWQMTLNLMGKSDEADLLKGNTLNSYIWVAKTPIEHQIFLFAAAELLIFNGEFEAAAESALKRGDAYAKALPSHPTVMLETFHRGVALYAMALRTKERKYKKHAKRIKKTIEEWTKGGNPNVKHYLCFLNAEQAAMDNRYNVTEEFYQDAIRLAARSGHLHHAALFSERYSNFLLETGAGDKREVKYRLEDAIRFYAAWGADGKVQRLMLLMNNESPSVLL